MSAFILRLSTWALLATAFVCPASTARAWTDARARSADVVVEVEPTGAARVLFDVELQVRGGWLEGYEVSGLDPDAALDTLKPPVLVGGDGEKWAPRARMREGGRLSLAFDRRGAPRRGTYRLRFAYRTQLAPRNGEPLPEGGTRLHWTLPAWRTGLDDVELWLWVPSKQARPVDSDEDADRHSARAFGDRTLVAFHRLHLPRATPWTVVVDMPASDELPLRRPESSGASWGGDIFVAPDVRGAAVTLFALCLLGWLRKRRARRRDVALRHLCGSPSRALLASALCVVLASALRGELQVFALAAAMLCSMGLKRSDPRPLRFGSWRRVGAAERRALRVGLLREIVGLTRAPDPLSLLGLAVWLGLLAWSLTATGSDGLAPVWPAACFALACVHTGLRWGPGGVRQLLSIFRLASQLRLSGFSLMVRAFFPGNGEPTQPRLQLLPAMRIAGLVRLEVSPRGAGLADGFVVLATVKSGSAADRWLEGAESRREESPGGQRACHLWSAGDAQEVAARVEALCSHCAQRAHQTVSRAA